MYAFVLYGLWLCSALNLLGIAVIRCIGVYFPRKSQISTLQKRSWIIPLLGWIVSTIWLLPTLVGTWGQFGFECQSFKCKFINANDEKIPEKYDPEHLFTFLIISIGLAIGILCTMTYFRLSKNLNQIREQIKDNTQIQNAKRLHDKERKIGKMVVTVTASFFIVYMPMVILRSMDHNAMVTKPTSYIVCYLCTCLVGTIDPLVYIFFQEKYRNAIMSLFKKELYQNTSRSI
jgi:hypothetical protein